MRLSVSVSFVLVFSQMHTLLDVAAVLHTSKQVQSAAWCVCKQSTGNSALWKKYILFKTLAFNDWTS